VFVAIEKVPKRREMKKRANTKDSRAFRSNRTDFHKKIEKNSLAFGGLNM
jgi:hypothetical protein